MILEASGLRLPDGLRGEGSALHRPFDLCLSAGEIVALEGPSGCGKTTTLRMLAGLEARAEGRLCLDGNPVTAAGMPAYRRSVLYLSQAPPPFPCTALESLRHLSRFATRKIAPPDAARFRAISTALGLSTEHLDRPLSDLSVGEAQRVALARAITCAPRVLLLDEPTSALDPTARDAAEAQVLQWLSDSDEPRAAVLVSHDHAQRARLADRSIVLGGRRA